MKAKWFGTLLILALLVIAVVPVASAAPKASDGAYDPTLVQADDNLPDPLTTKQLELKQQALEAKLNGKAYGKTGEVARGQYVQLELSGKGMVWTVMGEFTAVKHNQIAQQDLAVDNTS